MKKQSKLDRVQLIYGPPGTGKTTKLLEIMEQEIASGVKPREIAFVSFTRSARLVAKERAMLKFDVDEEDLVFFRTLHSTCFRSLGLTRSAVLSFRELKEFGHEFNYDFSYAGSANNEEDNFFSATGQKQGDRFLAFHHWMRHRMLTFEEAYKLWPDSLNYHQLVEFMRLYDDWRKQQSLLDFTDILKYGDNPIPVKRMILDEAQDLSDLQWEAFWRIATHAERIYIAGDDDQGIYAWSGANPEKFIDLQGDRQVLHQSYRLPRAVFAVSQRIAAKIRHRQEKQFNPRDADGAVYRYSSFDKVQFNSNETYKILVRNNYLKQDVLDTLLRKCIPHTDNGKHHIPDDFFVAAAAWGRLKAGMGISLRELRAAYNLTPSDPFLVRGAKKLVEDAIHAGDDRLLKMTAVKKEFGLKVWKPWHEMFLRLGSVEIAYLKSAVEEYGLPAVLDPKVDVSTIHASKGMEADNVVILTEMAGRCWHELQRNPDNEYRVWYVAVTRARNALHIVGDSVIFD